LQRIRQRLDRQTPDAVDAADVDAAVDDTEAPAVVAGQAVALVEQQQMIVGEQSETGIQRGDAEQPGTDRRDRRDEAPFQRLRPARGLHAVAAYLAHAGFGADEQIVRAAREDRTHARAGSARRRTDARQAVAAIAVQAAHAADPVVVADLFDRVDLV